VFDSIHLLNVEIPQRYGQYKYKDTISLLEYTQPPVWRDVFETVSTHTQTVFVSPISRHKIHRIPKTMKFLLQLLFYRYVSIHPNVCVYFTAYARDGCRKAEGVSYLFIYLYPTSTTVVCVYKFVTILSAFLEQLYACKGRRYQTRSAGLITHLHTNQTSDLYSRI
jgi:hypothetical protein